MQIEDQKLLLPEVFHIYLKSMHISMPDVSMLQTSPKLVHAVTDKHACTCLNHVCHTFHATDYWTQMLNEPALTLYKRYQFRTHVAVAYLCKSSWNAAYRLWV